MLHTDTVALLELSLKVAIVIVCMTFKPIKTTEGSEEPEVLGSTVSVCSVFHFH